MSGPRLAPTSSIYGHPTASSTGAPIYAMSASTGGPYPPFLGGGGGREEDKRQVYLTQAGRFMQQMEASGQKAAYAQVRLVLNVYRACSKIQSRACSQLIVLFIRSTSVGPYPLDIVRKTVLGSSGSVILIFGAVDPDPY
jgi:hypothetical protein